ncbi:MAG TPA: deaminase [Gemmataceae bacterium]|jgi:pyrimidine deaminase RibD-like protein
MSSNPLHALIEQLGQYVRAVWRCHHASTNEEKHEASQMWQTLIDPFWKTHRIPAEAIRGLADPALSWCGRRGFNNQEHIATVEQAVHFIIELAKLTVPCAMPSVYANKDKAQQMWEQQGKFLLAALTSQDALRRLAALTGDEWKEDVRMPWDTDPQRPSSPSEIAATTPVPTESSTSSNDREFMELAIKEARKCVGEVGRANPKVGAVVVKNGKLMASAYRGEQGVGEHAEYTALEKKLSEEVVAGATVYTTLEPCTTRNHPKVPCASRLIERRVKRVVIGMLDPNPAICGKGERLLRDHGIVVDRFPRELIVELEELNRDFTRAQKQTISGTQNRLFRIATHKKTHETIDISHCEQHGRPVVPVWLGANPDRMCDDWLVKRLPNNPDLQLYFAPKWGGGTWFVADVRSGDGVVINPGQLADLRPSSPTTTTTPAPQSSVG